MNRPSSDLLELIEYRLRSVSIGHMALQHATNWDKTPSISIFFDGKQVVEGKATAFTNPAIEAAIIHSRALLEFIGLSGRSQTELKEISSRKKKDDEALEKIEGLEKVTIKRATEEFSKPAKEVEAALAYVIYLANKGLAHTTTSFSKHDDGTALLEIAFRVVQTLLVNYFYMPLNIPPPRYQLGTRKRD